MPTSQLPSAAGSIGDLDSVEYARLNYVDEFSINMIEPPERTLDYQDQVDIEVETLLQSRRRRLGIDPLTEEEPPDMDGWRLAVRLVRSKAPSPESVAKDSQCEPRCIKKVKSKLNPDSHSIMPDAAAK
jgi:hypothetical protein